MVGGIGWGDKGVLSSILHVNNSPWFNYYPRLTFVKCLANGLSVGALYFLPPPSFPPGVLLPHPHNCRNPPIDPRQSQGDAHLRWLGGLQGTQVGLGMSG